MLKSIGLDVGGTNISAVVCDEKGNIISSMTRKSDYFGNQYLSNIDDIIGLLLKESGNDAAGIGIGIPGTVEYSTGKVTACPAFDWKDVLLGDHIKNKFGLKTYVDNDVNGWTLAEKYLGAAKDYDDFAMITIGTGIGCGLYLNGNLYRGHSYEAGEIGFIPLGMEAYDRQQPGANEFGFFENVASASAASRIYKEMTGRFKSCKDIFILARQGDKAAEKVVGDVHRYLGLGISSIFCLINPQIVVIGGGMAEEGPEFLSEIERNVRQLIPLKVNLSLSEAGAYGGAIGSALAVFHNQNSKETLRTNRKWQDG